MIIINEQQLPILVNVLNEMNKAEIDKRMKDVDTNPTEAQKKAGNYRMAHIYVKGMNITIENPKGSKRRYKNPDGSDGYNVMHNHYGYFNCSLGKDGDAVDVFIGPKIDDFENVYVVDQNNKEGDFDESKVMLGFDDKKKAKDAYMSNYSGNWKGFRDITEVPLDIFKRWLYRGRKQRIPFSEYVAFQK